MDNFSLLTTIQPVLAAVFNSLLLYPLLILNKARKITSLTSLQPTLLLLPRLFYLRPQY